MQVRNDYNHCLTNLACSIRKYFELDYKHKTLDFVDIILTEKKPENVVVVLFDGMGANILKRTLPATAFFCQNLTQEITTVFPATTTAATTSIRTGLNPVEHGWLGWTTYIQPIDKVITLFLNSEKGDDEHICEEFLQVKNQLVNTTITEEINQAGRYKSLELMPFGDDAYQNLDEMIERIKTETAKPGKKYIYAYDDEPDGTMHEKGPDSPEAQALIKERDQKIAKLAQELKNTLLIVVADHGHIKTENIFLQDYPEIMNLLARKTSIDQRAVSFKVKPGKKAEFKKLFNYHFGKFYQLYDADEIIQSQLFGDGKENPLYRPALGDFLAIATSSQCLVSPYDEILYSHHAGYTDDEILVPIITKFCD